LRKAFHAVLADLAEQVARDGEGARKLVEITVEGATVEAVRAQDRDVDRQLAAGENRRLPARTPTGAASSWRSARPASRRIATSCRSGSTASASRHKGARDPSYDEAEVSAAMKKPEIRSVAMGWAKAATAC
jgi:glutamate N-acetyltransferase/amino-acid N-acetyltransferase